MSGGSYDYAYRHIDEIAEQLRVSSPLRKAFVKHLRAVAKACKDIEREDSGDLGTGDADAAIRSVLGPGTGTMVLREVLEDAKRVERELNAAIKAAEKVSCARS